VTIDFGFGVGFRWQRWIYVWVSTVTVGLALGFNGASGGFVVSLMDLGFEGGGGFGFCGGFVVGLMDLGIEGGGGFGFCSGFGFGFRRWWVSALMVGGIWVCGGFRLKWWWVWVCNGFGFAVAGVKYGGKVEKKN
jgi:hypothetical protein